MAHAHDQLKEVARKLLTERGFQLSEIHEEYWIDSNQALRKIRVDIVGINQTHKVAVECGHTPAEKIAVLKTYFDEVIVLPYFTLNNDSVDREIALRRALEKVDAQQKEITKLKEERRNKSNLEETFTDMARDWIEIAHRIALDDEKYYVFLSEDNLDTLISKMIGKLEELRRIKKTNEPSILPTPTAIY